METSFAAFPAGAVCLTLIHPSLRNCVLLNCCNLLYVVLFLRVTVKDVHPHLDGSIGSTAQQQINAFGKFGKFGLHCFTNCHILQCGDEQFYSSKVHIPPLQNTLGYHEGWALRGHIVVHPHPKRLVWWLRTMQVRFQRTPETTLKSKSPK